MPTGGYGHFNIDLALETHLSEKTFLCKKEDEVLTGGGLLGCMFCESECPGKEATHCFTHEGQDSH